MFNLDQQIGAWRQGLLDRGVVGPADVDELEDHLRQETEQLSKLALTDQEAFLVASQRLGAVEALDTEYSKVCGPALFLRRLQWMLLGSISFGVLGQFSQLVTNSLVSLTMMTGLTPRWTLFLGAIGELLLAIAVLWCVVSSAGTRSGVAHRLMTQLSTNHSQRFAVVVVAMVISSSLMLGLNGVLMHHQIHEMQTNKMHPNASNGMAEFFFARSAINRAWAFGLPISLAILTVWARRRNERGYTAR